MCTNTMTSWKTLYRPLGSCHTRASGTTGRMARDTMGMKVLVLGKWGMQEKVIGKKGMREQVRGMMGMREQVLDRKGTKELGTMGTMGKRGTARTGRQLIACHTHSHSGTHRDISCSTPVQLPRRRSPHGYE